MARFFVYEEYGAKYESTLHDMASASKHIPNWHAYERGIEALAHSLKSNSGREGNNRKGLTFEDLLIKVRTHTHRMITRAYIYDSPYSEYANTLCYSPTSTGILL